MGPYIYAIDWGDVPTWVSAITTLGALLAAGWVVRIELRRDSANDRLVAEQREAAARSEQADDVAAWEVIHREQPAILVRNGSRLPIYDVEVELVHHRQEPRPLQRQRMLPPGDHHAVYPDDIVHDDGLGNLTDDSMSWGIRLTFYDTAGRRWIRNVEGQLVRLPTGDVFWDVGTES